MKAFVEECRRLHFPNLENISIGLMLVGAADVRDFLFKHKSTLKKLAFTHTSNHRRQELWNRQLLSAFRKGFQLESFVSGLKWESNPLYFKDWTPIGPGRGSSVNIVRLIELYVTGKIDWPMPTNDSYDAEGQMVNTPISNHFYLPI